VVRYEDIIKGQHCTNYINMRVAGHWPNGGSISECGDLVATISECSGTYFQYAPDFGNGDCGCATDECDARTNDMSWVIYRIVLTSDPTPTEIGIEEGAPYDEDTLKYIGAEGSGENPIYKVFECSGQDNFIKWSINYCKEDFKITSTFQAAEGANESAVSFVLWEGSAEYYFGLDGEGRRFFLGNTLAHGTEELGATTLKKPETTNDFQTIELHRDGGKLSVKLDGEEVAGMQDLAMGTMCVDAVGWRPRGNTLRVRALYGV
jgi:hypothetical protein